jgi:hypothetical protein
MRGTPAYGAERTSKQMSAIAETPSGTASNSVNTRAFLAGGGATTALIAAAVIAFLSVAALVAFNGLPIGGDDADAGSVQVGEVPATGANAPELAAAALGDALGAVAATPAASTAVDPTQIPGFAGSGGAPAVPGAPGTVPGGSGAPRVPGTGSTGSEVLGGTVGGVDNTAGNLGLDLPLNDATNGLTGPLDQTLNDTLNNVGGAAGNPNLGNQVGGAVNNVTNGLPEPKAVDQLVNP